MKNKWIKVDRLWAFLWMLLIFTACEGITKSIKDTFKNGTEDVQENEALAGKTTDTTDIPVDSTIAEIIKPYLKEIEKDSTAARVVTSHLKQVEKVLGERNSRNFLKDTLALARAQQSLKNLPQFNGKKIKLYGSLHFYDNGRISINVQHPENAEYVDEYHYENGAWSAPKPVQLSVRTKVESKLFDLDNIQFETVAKIVRIYNEKAASLAGAKTVGHVYGLVFDKRFIWYPRSIGGDRMRYAIDFNLDGSLKSYRRE